MLNIKTIFKSKVVQTLIVSVPNLFSGILLSIFVAQILRPHFKGVHGLIGINIELFVLVLGLSLGTAITYFIANKKISSGKVLSMTLSIAAFGVMVISASYFVGKILGYNIIISNEGFISIKVIAYFFIIYFVTILKQMGIAFIQGFSKINWINRYTLISAVLNVSLIIPLFYYLNIEVPSQENFEAVLSMLIVINVLSILPLLYFCVKVIRIENIKLEKFGFSEELKPFLKFAFIGHLSNVINFLNYRIDIWFIMFFYHDQYDIISYYLLAVSLSIMIWLIPNAINLVYFPRLCENPSIETTIKITRFNNLLVSVACLIGFFVTPYVLPLLYTDEYIGAVIPFQILLIGIFFSSLTKTISTLIFAMGKVKINLYATIVGLVITMIFDLILIPKYGIIGAAWATNITYFSIFVVCFIFIWRRAKQENLGQNVWAIFIPYLTRDLKNDR